MVAHLLHELGSSRQANAKTIEGTSHPDRDAQFEHINERVRQYRGRGEPVISVDTKKKELVGEFKNGGRELRPHGQPEQVQVHDCVTDLGRAIPYGVDDRGTNTGGVSVGLDHDTAEFAVAAREARPLERGVSERVDGPPAIGAASSVSRLKAVQPEDRQR